MSDLWGALGDAQFWKGVADNARALPERLAAYGKIPEQADAIAEANFPGSARDASAKNAFRHALGTGMTAQALGGGFFGAAAAKGLGYVWEGLGIGDQAKLAKEWNSGDILHDLNANAIGAQAARETTNQQELVEVLKRMGQQSVQRAPPGLFERHPGYLTRSVR